MLDDAEGDRWRQAASEALEAARSNTMAGWHNWACMISEQAAQLAVKGLLHTVGRGDVARGHDLLRLVDAAAETAGLDVGGQIRAAAGRLVRHYQPTRYPDALPGGTPHSSYSAADAERALDDAAAVVGAVDRTKAALADAERDSS